MEEAPGRQKDTGREPCCLGQPPPSAAVSLPWTLRHRTCGPQPSRVHVRLTPAGQSGVLRGGVAPGDICREGRFRCHVLSPVCSAGPGEGAAESPALGETPLSVPSVPLNADVRREASHVAGGLRGLAVARHPGSLPVTSFLFGQSPSRTCTQTGLWTGKWPCRPCVLAGARGLHPSGQPRPRAQSPGQGARGPGKGSQWPGMHTGARDTVRGAYGTPVTRWGPAGAACS